MTTTSNSQYSGKIVALDGLAQDALETQLRLLPCSPHILVLPSLQQYLGESYHDVVPFASSVSAASFASAVPPLHATHKSPSSSASFDARRYIKAIHTAAAAREAIALQFLQNSGECNSIHESRTDSPPQKTVFFTGGTATSHALCISAIQEHDAAAGGSLEQAALIFDRLMGSGVAGLQDAVARPSAQETSRPSTAAEDENEDEAAAHENDSPIARAMRAADALDRKTQSLQYDTHIFDPTVASKPRSQSFSLAVYSEASVRRDAGRRPDRVLKPTEATDSKDGKFYKGSDSSFISHDTPVPQLFSEQAETDLDEHDSDCLIKTRASFNDPSMGRSSIDRGTSGCQCPAVFAPVLPLVEDIVICFDNDNSSTPRQTTALDIAIQRCRNTKCTRTKDHDNLSTQNQSIQAGGPAQALLDQHTLSSALPETPVSSSHEYSSSPSTTASSSLRIHAATGPVTTTFSTDDYDPFAPHEYNACPKTPLPLKPSSAPKQRRVPRPLTPAQSPSPPHPSDDGPNGNGTQFHVLATTTFSTAFALHNALRSSLNTLLSPGAASGSLEVGSDATDEIEKPIRDLASCVPGFAGDRLWAPLFETAQQTRAREQSDIRAANCVLAIGSQHDVPFDLMSKITGRLDVLGCQSDIATIRGGRLDIRYLIANALQSLEMQRAYGRESRFDIPGLDSSLSTSLLSTRASFALAALVIAQLDLYLRTCPTASKSSPAAARLFLLEYPAELLPVVLALQQLMGRSVVHVAIVVADKDPQYPKDGCHQAFQALSQAPLSLQSPLSPSLGLELPSREPLYMSADYLLTSAAGGIDIAKFVAAVRKQLLLGVNLPKTIITDARRDSLVTPSLASPQDKKGGSRFSASPTMMGAASGTGGTGGTGANGCDSSINSRLQTPTYASDLLLSPKLLSPPLVSSGPSPLRMGLAALDNEKRFSSTSSGIRRSHPRPLPLTIFLNGQTTSSSASASLPIASPALSYMSMQSMQSMQSQASSLQSFQSQSEPWYTVAKATGYMVAATALAPAPILHPNNRLVAKQIQVHGPAAARRAREQKILEEAASLAHVSDTSVSSAQSRSDRGHFGNLDSPGLSCDENYVLNISRSDTGFSKRTTPRGSVSIRNSIRNSMATTHVYEFGSSVSLKMGGGVAEDSDGHDININNDEEEEEYESGQDDDDFDNDPDMRRLMPLFMRDRAALLAAKEAAGVRDVRPVPLRTAPGLPMGLSAPRPGSVSAARAASASASASVSASPQRSLASLRGKASTNSIRSQASQHGSVGLAGKSGHEGRKALKWLGLA
ncbi:hypothetical protein SEPCBS119000_002626 [Sporothrix epigloea]|uniref:Gastric mucin-like protein n=1 Tax=Sporothrix epigloea TaxID=1892477 RepID=A0ABP0DH57_9PEZI